MSHLKKISLEIQSYMADIEVALLIGLNCPSALHLRDIVYSEESDPYAVHSRLELYVNGPSKLHSRVVGLHTTEFMFVERTL